MRIDRNAVSLIPNRGHAASLIMLGMRNKEGVLAEQLQAVNDAIQAGEPPQAFVRLVLDLHQTASELREEFAVLQDLLPPVTEIAA